MSCKRFLWEWGNTNLSTVILTQYIKVHNLGSPRGLKPFRNWEISLIRITVQTTFLKDLHHLNWKLTSLREINCHIFNVFLKMLSGIQGTYYVLFLISKSDQIWWLEQPNHKGLSEINTETKVCYKLQKQKCLKEGSSFYYNWRTVRVMHIHFYRFA